MELTEIYLIRDYTVAVQMGDTEAAERLAAELTGKGIAVPEVEIESLA